ncbi:MAG: enoyl-CoA hydratase/isomerase family protein [Variibacter sp.]|nr:enoyl-CoA hydratase/isomerase family protein [Variibacter sp.]
MIEHSEQDGIRVLRLAHGKASALDLELVEALRAALERAGKDAVRAVVLTGSAHIFCAGVDLKRVAEGGADYVRRYLPAFRELMFALLTFPRPLVVAANGHAIAGGAVLVAAGDYRLMAAGGGRFGYTELLVGVPFPPAALEIIRLGTPSAQRQAMLYTAATFPPQEALARGCVDEVVAPDRLMQRALAVAQQIGRIAPAAFAETKRHLRAQAVRAAQESEAAFGDEVLAQWCAEETHGRIRAYLDSAVRKR